MAEQRQWEHFPLSVRGICLQCLAASPPAPGRDDGVKASLPTTTWKVPPHRIGATSATLVQLFVIYRKPFAPSCVSRTDDFACVPVQHIFISICTCNDGILVLNRQIGSAPRRDGERSMESGIWTGRYIFFDSMQDATKSNFLFKLKFMASHGNVFCHCRMKLFCACVSAKLSSPNKDK